MSSRRLPRHWRGIPLEQVLMICALVASSQMTWGALVPVLPQYARTFGVGAAQVGLLIAGFGIGRVVANWPAGALTRRLSARTLILVGTCLVVAMSAACGLATSFEMLVVFRVLSGVGGGIAVTIGQLLLADLAGPSDRASVMALLQGVTLLGVSVAPAAGGLMASAFGPTAPFFGSGAVALILVVWILIRRIPLGAEPRYEPGRSEGGGRLLGNRDFLAVCGVGFAVFLTRFGGLQTLLPLLAVEVVGLSVGELGVLVGAMALVNLVVVMTLGTLSDRFGRKRPTIVSMAGVAVAITLLPLNAGAVVFVAVCLALGFVTSVGGPIPAAYLVDVVDASRRGSAIGVFRTFGDLAGIIGPIVVGTVVEHAGFAAAAVILAGVNMVVAASFGVVAAETVGLAGDDGSLSDLTTTRP